MISFSTRLFTKAKCQIALVVKYIYRLKEKKKIDSFHIDVLDNKELRTFINMQN